MAFSNLLGNPFAKEQLQKMVDSGRVPPVLLFHGPQGSCKKLFAKALAGRLLGKESLDNHPDFHLLEPQGKAHTMAAITQLLAQTTLPAYSAPCKLFLIEQAHLMLPSSSNALLKLLEEPPEKTYFVLLTDEKEQILPTILSRSQLVAFHPIPEAEIENYLVKMAKIPSDKAKRCAFIAMGSLDRALEASRGNKEADAALSLCSELLCQNRFLDPLFLEKALLQIDKLLDSKEEEQSALARYSPLFEKILLWYRDLNLLQLGLDQSHLFHQGHLNELLDTHKTSKIKLPSLSKLGLLLEEAKEAISFNIQPKQALENFFFKLQIR